MRKLFKEIFVPIIVLTVICIVISAALALTNSITKDRISNLEAENQSKAMQALIPDCVYENINFDFTDSGVSDLYLAKSSVAADNALKGYIMTSSAKGYGGEVKIMVAVSPDKKIMGVNVLSLSDETPGLGQNVGKADFYRQCIGKKSGVTLVKNGAVEENNEVNAVTGATISSKAFTLAINDALAVLDEYTAGLAKEVQ